MHKLSACGAWLVVVGVSLVPTDANALMQTGSYWYCSTASTEVGGISVPGGNCWQVLYEYDDGSGGGGGDFDSEFGGGGGKRWRRFGRQPLPVIGSGGTDTVSADGTQVHTTRFGCGDLQDFRQETVQRATLQQNTQFPGDVTVTLYMAGGQQQTFVRMSTTTSSYQFQPTSECSS